MSYYYKDGIGNLYVDPILANHGNITKISKEEFDALAKPVKSSAEIAATNQAAAKALRDSSIDNYVGSVTYDDSVFDADNKSLVNIDTAVRLALAAGETETSWRLSDNKWRPTTISEITEIRDLIQADVDANFAKVWLAFGAWDAGSEEDKQTPFAVS